MLKKGVSAASQMPTDQQEMVAEQTKLAHELLDECTKLQSSFPTAAHDAFGSSTAAAPDSDDEDLSGSRGGSGSGSGGGGSGMQFGGGSGSAAAGSRKSRNRDTDGDASMG